MSNITIQQQKYLRSTIGRVISGQKPTQYFNYQAQPEGQYQQKEKKKNFWDLIKDNIVGIALIAFALIPLSFFLAKLKPRTPNETSSKPQGDIKRTVPGLITFEQKIALASEVCKDGNQGKHCQTLAPLNALRILNAWGDPRGKNLNLESIKDSLENIGKGAFIRRVNWLDDGTMINGSSIKSIVPQIIFDELQIPYGEYILSSSDPAYDKARTHPKNLLKALKKLKEGSVGVLSFAYKLKPSLDQYGGHMNTIYGFEPGSSYSEFERLMDSSNNQIPPEDFERLLPNLGRIFCYEQDNQIEEIGHHQLELCQLLSGSGKYLSPKLILMDGDPSERGITISTIMQAFNRKEFAQMLRPNLRETFNTLPDDKKSKYVLSRAWDLGARAIDPQIFDFEKDYIPALIEQSI